MAWDKNKPAGGQKIRLSDEEIRENWNCLEDALGREHTFPGVFAGTAGEHASATEGGEGMIELATQAEADAGADAVRAITPATLKGVIDDRMVVAADQAEMEAAAINTEFVTPANIKWAPSVAKAWVNFDNLGNIRSGYNVASVNRDAQGLYTVTFTTAFSNTNYVTVVTPIRGCDNLNVAAIGALQNAAAYGDVVAVGSVKVGCYNYDGSPIDVKAMMVVCFGDQA